MMWYNTRMKKIFFALGALLSVLGVAVDPQPEAGGAAADGATNAPPALAAQKTRIRCAVCEGRGRLKVRPPDVGQFAGRIESRSHWDVNLDPCPVCGRGHGWRTVWDLTQPEPRAEAPCTKCGWSGLVQCRRCLATGIVSCPHAGCKDGWIIEDQLAGGRRRSSRKVQSAKRCPECKGAGKVICPVCKGLRAELCNRCFGCGRNRR